MPSKRERRVKWNNVGKDVVVLHMFPRAKFSPNLSPYPIKLETFLRMTKIKYEVDFEEPIGSKGKSPWMTFNGQEVADSHICIDHLKRDVEGVDLDAHLTAEERAVARGFRALFEDHLYFCLVTMRYLYNSPKEVFDAAGKMPVPLPIAKMLFPLIRRRMRGQVVGQGIGRHSREEVLRVAIDDLRAVSVFLGDKPFLMGDQPSTVDCTIFGFLVGIIFNSGPSNAIAAAVREDFPNLRQYTLRIKEKYWQDWDDCLYKPAA